MLSRFAMIGALLASTLSCSLETNTQAEKICRGDETKHQSYVITSLTFTRETPKGVAPGFDLDNHVTTVPDDPGCGKTDLVDPQGNPGIDNQLALLIPEIEKKVGNAIDGIIQGAINDGRLLIAFDVQHLEDQTNDDCVDMKVELAQGKPSLGTDGVVEAWQTFDLRQTGQQTSFGRAGKITNRKFEIGPFPLRIPIAIFDVSFMVFIRDAHIRFTIDDDGNIEGLLGGGVSIDEIAEGVKNGAGVAPLIPQIKFIGEASADLGYDPVEGKCSLVSAALAFKARPAFIRPSSEASSPTTGQ
ncbi:MAG: hypothetical protein ACXVEE_24100 [Polyangiales bacterium]